MVEPLEKSSLFLRTVKTLPYSIILADARRRDTPIVYVNAEFERLTGYTFKECKGKNCRFLQGIDRQQPVRKILRAALRQRSPVKVILRNYKKSGELFWNELSVVPLVDDRGNVDYFASIQRNVSVHIVADLAEGLHRQKGSLDLQPGFPVGAPASSPRFERQRTSELNAQVIRRKVVANIEQSLLPLLRQLEKSTDIGTTRYAEALKSSLSELSSGFGLRLSHPMYALTPREIEICHHVRQGLQTKEIAALLTISEATVENQRNSIRRKLGLRSSDGPLIHYLRAL